MLHTASDRDGRHAGHARRLYGPVRHFATIALGTTALSAAASVRLRPHHLLCLLTYAGEGYSARCIANYDRLARRLSAGEALVDVGGPDDVCGPVLDAPGSHCRNAGVALRDRRAAASIEAVVGHTIAAGSVLALDAAALATLRGAFEAGATRAA